MAYLSSPRTGIAVPNMLARTADAIGAFFAQLQRARMLSAEFEILASMDDDQLAARGETRAQALRRIAARF